MSNRGRSNLSQTKWSEWERNDEYNCDYRYRRNWAGEWEYEYGPVLEDHPAIEGISSSSANFRFDDKFRDESYRTLGAQDEPQPSTKATDVVEAKESSSDSAKLSEGLESLRVSEQTATIKVGISDSALKSNPGVDTSRVLCTWPGCSETFIWVSGRDRHYQTIHANNGDRPYKCLVEGCSANVKSWARIEKLRAHNKIWHGPYHCPVKGCSRGFPCGFGSQQDLDEHIVEAHSDSAQPSSENKMLSQLKSSDYSQAPSPSIFSSQQGPSASASIEETPPFSAPPPSDFRTAPLTLIKEEEPEVNPYGFQLAENSPGLPSPPQPPTYETFDRYKGPSRIFATDPNSKVDRVDPNFRVHKSKDFYFGRVFKVLWSEPSGSGGTDISSDDDMPMKAKAYTKTRRFVIVDTRRGHSICLPILTYGGQGTLKHGIHPEDHAQIFTLRKGAKKAPPLLPGEQLSKRAIRVEPISPSHKLHPLSRINYAKLYTVEHNIKVYFIGRVAKRYEQLVITDYNNTHRPLPDRSYPSLEQEEAYLVEGGEDFKSSYLEPYDYSSVGEDPEASTAAGSSPTPWNPNQSSHDPPSIEDPEQNTPDVSDDIPNIYDVDC